MWPIFGWVLFFEDVSTPAKNFDFTYGTKHRGLWQLRYSYCDVRFMGALSTMQRSRRMTPYHATSSSWVYAMPGFASPRLIHIVRSIQPEHNHSNEIEVDPSFTYVHAFTSTHEQRLAARSPKIVSVNIPEDSSFSTTWVQNLKNVPE